MKVLLFCCTLFLTLILLSFSCNEDPAEVSGNVPLGDTVEIAAQQTVTFDPDDFKIRFDLVGDSRCPSDVQCVWGGRADAKLTFTLGSETVTDILSIGGACEPCTPDSLVVLGHMVQLLKVSPYPVSTDSIAPEDYIIQVVVTQ